MGLVPLGLLGWAGWLEELSLGPWYPRGGGQSIGDLNDIIYHNVLILEGDEEKIVDVVIKIASYEETDGVKQAIDGAEDFVGM